MSEPPASPIAAGRYLGRLLRLLCAPHVVLGRYAGTRLRILMYHSVADNPLDQHAVAPAAFQATMERVAAEFDVIGLAEALQRLRGGQGLRRTLVLTFDDGYRDFLPNVLPVLRALGLPATLFVPTSLVGATAVWDSCDRGKPLLTWDELRTVEAAGVQIASHTQNHLRLPEVPDAMLERELVESWQTLQTHLRAPFPALSYPGGAYGPREMAAARAAGYRCALGVSSRWGNGRESDLFALRREAPFAC